MREWQCHLWELLVEWLFFGEWGGKSRTVLLLWRISKLKVHLCLKLRKWKLNKKLYGNKIKRTLVKNSDRNSCFFHASIMVRRKRNFIWAVMEDESHWIEDRDLMADFFRSKFLETFNSTNPEIDEELFTLVESCISMEENDSFIVVPSLGGVRKWTGNLDGGRFLALVNWGTICKPKNCGGLGICSFRDINICLLAKLRVNEFNDDDRLVWRTSPNGEFSIKAPFKNMHKDALVLDDEAGSKLWKLSFQDRLKLFLWKSYWDCLPFGLRTSWLWLDSKWRIQIDELSLSLEKDVVSGILNPFSYLDSNQLTDREEFSLYATVLYHNLWFFRNANFHNNVKWRFFDMKKKIVDDFHNHWKVPVSLRSEASASAYRLAVRWRQPRPGRIRVNVDFATTEGVGAIGVVAWYEFGGIKALFVTEILMVSVTHGELEAISKGVKVLCRLGIWEA
uniref:Uncharacterized protein n=1 Tax=Cannabis sativa TaxID=3483 RepID=A0A803PK11_CANSA